MAAIGHVGVIGAGLGGLAAALAAARAGLRVDVFEAEPTPVQAPAHIDVVPSLLRDLVGLGIGEACVRHGFPYHGFAVMDGEGRTHLEIPTSRLAGLRFPASLGMVYGDLLALLRDAAVARGARLHLGTAVRNASDAGAIVAVEGERHHVDLAVIATGADLPAVATCAARPMSLESLPQKWCHALLPRPVGLERAARVIGSGSLKAMLVRPVRSGVIDGPWHAHGALRIGDSAHVLPPHFGQAAAQAVEDAVVLGDLLRQRMERDDLLSSFMARRGERARCIHAAATQAARWDLRPEASTDLRALAERLAPMVAEPA